MSRRNEDPDELTYAQIYARIFTHFSRVTGRPAKVIARAAGCSEGYISMISRAERLPALEMTRELDRAICADGCLYEIRRLIERLKGQRAIHPRTLGDEPLSGTEEDPVRRRQLIQDAATLATGATTAPLLAALTHAWETSEPTLPGASISQTMIEDWQDAAIAHARRARLDSPALVLAALTVDIAGMAPHLRKPQPDRVRKDLAHAAARHTALIAGKWTDLGNRREASRWWKKTRTLSDRSGDAQLSSLLRTREALHRADDLREDLSEVLTLAREAHRLAGPRPNVATVRARANEAAILALMGREYEAVAALRDADDMFERLPADETRRCERDLWFDRSLVYSLVGDVQRSATAQGAARGMYPAGDQALPRLELHHAAAHAPTDPGNAIREAIRVMRGIPSEHRMSRHLSDAQRVLGILPERARSLPAARELRALTSGHDRA